MNETIPHDAKVLSADFYPSVQDGTYEDCEDLTISFFAEQGRLYLAQANFAVTGDARTWENVNAKRISCKWRNETTGWETAVLPMVDKWISSGYAHSTFHSPAKIIYGDDRYHTFKLSIQNTLWLGAIGSLSSTLWIELPENAIVFDDREGVIYNTASSTPGLVKESEFTLPDLDDDWVIFTSKTIAAETDNSRNQVWADGSTSDGASLAEVTNYTRAYTNSWTAKSDWSLIRSEFGFDRVGLFHSTSSSQEGLRLRDRFILGFHRSEVLGVGHTLASGYSVGSSSNQEIGVAPQPLAGEKYISHFSNSIGGQNGVWRSYVRDVSATRVGPSVYHSGRWAGHWNVGATRILENNNFNLSHAWSRLKSSNTSNAYYPRSSWVNIGYKPRGLKEDIWLCPTIRDNIQDLSGNNVAITKHADTVLATESGEGGTHAWQFDRSTSSDISFGTHVEATDNAATFACWMNCTDLQDFSVFMGQSSTGLTAGIGVYVAADGSICAYQGNHTTQAANAPTGTIKANKWYHICFTAEAVDALTNTDLKLYVNGELIDDRPANGRPFNADDYSGLEMRIGRAGSYGFSGQIDDFRFYENRAVSSEDIAFVSGVRGREEGDEIAEAPPVDRFRNPVFYPSSFEVA